MQKRSISLADVASPGSIHRHVDEHTNHKRGNRLSCFVLCVCTCLPPSFLSFSFIFFFLRFARTTSRSKLDDIAGGHVRGTVPAPVFTGKRTYVWHKRLIYCYSLEIFYWFMKRPQWFSHEPADKWINRPAGTLGLFGYHFYMLNNARHRTWSHFLKTLNYSDRVASLRFNPEFEIKVYWGISCNHGFCFKARFNGSLCGLDMLISHVDHVYTG